MIAALAREATAARPVPERRSTSPSRQKKSQPISPQRRQRRPTAIASLDFASRVQGLPKAKDARVASAKASSIDGPALEAKGAQALLHDVTTIATASSLRRNPVQDGSKMALPCSAIRPRQTARSQRQSTSHASSPLRCPAPSIQSQAVA